MAGNLFIHMAALSIMITAIVLSVGNEMGVWPGNAQIITTGYNESGAQITKLTDGSGAGDYATGPLQLAWNALGGAISGFYNTLMCGPFLMGTFHVPAALAAAAQAIVDGAFAYEIYMFLKGVNVL